MTRLGTRRWLLAVSAAAMLATSCGDGDGVVTSVTTASSDTGSTMATVETGDESTSSTADETDTGGDTTSSSAGTDTSSTTSGNTTTISSAIDEELAALEVPDEVSLEALPDDLPADRPPLVGSSDRVAASIVREDLIASGFDVTGIEIGVWPIDRGRSSLLIVEIDDSAASLGEDDEATVALLAALADQPVLAERNVERFALVYRGEDETGVFILTITDTLDALRAVAAGDDEALADTLVQLEVVEP